VTFFPITDTSRVRWCRQIPTITMEVADHDNKSLVHFIYTCMATTSRPLVLWQIIALFCLVLKRWVCTFCACIKVSSLKPRPTTALIPSSGLASSEDRFLAFYLSCYFFPHSLGWSYVFSFRSLSFCRDALQVIHCFHISHCFHILR
jgi:hypothetical protein